MRRGISFVFLFGFLAACSAGGDTAPFAESRTPPGLAERFYPPEGWAWGFVQLGEAPAQRYGVAAATGTARADILILPDYGETAETWFETVHDLTGRGYRVWVLEAAGQGGSGRLRGPRDMGDAQSFDPDVAAVRAMANVVIRPTSASPLFVLAQGTGAVVAVQAVRAGAPAMGLALSSPKLGVEAGARPPTPGARSWRGDMKNAFAVGATHDPWRGAVTFAWQRANPDLRMGGPSARWSMALRKAAGDARGDLKGIKAPTLVIEGQRAGGCLEAPHCLAVRLAGAGEALELERDGVRDAWIAAIDDFIRRSQERV